MGESHILLLIHRECVSPALKKVSSQVNFIEANFYEKGYDFNLVIAKRNGYYTVSGWGRISDTVKRV